MTTSGQPFKVDRAARKARQKTRPSRTATGVRATPARHRGNYDACARVCTHAEEAEARALVTTLARSFVAMIEFYKSPYGGEKPHDLAVAEAEAFHKHTLEWARSKPEGIDADKISWHQIAVFLPREFAEDSLMCGRGCARWRTMISEWASVAQWPDQTPALTRSRSSLRSARRSLTSGNHAAASNPP